MDCDHCGECADCKRAIDSVYSWERACSQENAMYADAHGEESANVKAFADKLRAFVRANAPEGSISTVKVELTHSWDSSIDDTFSINLEEI